MSTDDELPPEIVNQLRSVPPASDAVREMHIANALSELPRARTRPAQKFVAVAAAAIVFVASGAAFLSQQSDSPAMAQHSVQTLGTVPAKGALETVDSTLTSTCAQDGEEVVGSYELDGTTASLIKTPTGLRIAADSACKGSTYLPFPTERPNTAMATDCSPPDTWDMLFVGHFADANGFSYWVGVNDYSIGMWDCASPSLSSDASHPQT